MRKFIKKFKNSIIGKILKVVWKVLWWILEALIIFIALVIVTQRFTNNQKTFLGFRIFSVATGSMEPQYAVGDVLISREKEPSEIQVGEDIVYLGEVADYKGKIITHKVIDKKQNEAGEYLFHTKGIANNIEDPVVHEDQLYGVIFYNNELLAFLCKILTNRYGLYCFVVVVIIYFFIGFVRNQGERIEQEREQELKIREKQRKTQNRRELENRKEIQAEEEIIQPLEEKNKKKTARKVEEQEEIKSTRKTAIPKKKVEQEEPVKEKKQTTTRKASNTKKKAESEEIKAIKSTKKKDDSQKGTVESKKTTRAKNEE